MGNAIVQDWDAAKARIQADFGVSYETYAQAMELALRDGRTGYLARFMSVCDIEDSKLRRLVARATLYEKRFGQPQSAPCLKKDGGHLYSFSDLREAHSILQTADRMKKKLYALRDQQDVINREVIRLETEYLPFESLARSIQVIVQKARLATQTPGGESL